MTDEQLIIAVAKLDGWVREESEHPTFKSRIVWWTKHIGTFERRIAQVELPPYLTSHDAIIPVIEKQRDAVKILVMRELYRLAASGPQLLKDCSVLCSTPKQLSIALVKATGNWIE